MDSFEKISYAKTVYGKEEVDAVIKCLSESTQMGNYSGKFEKKIADLFDKNIVYTLIQGHLLFILV